MRHSLVVYAHPEPSSYCAQLRDAAIRGLVAGGHDVDVVDLYADRFDARLSTAERRAYEKGSPILDPRVRSYADLVVRAETLVFVYPTWWWGLPAVLKGWLERVLVPGVGFVLDPHTNKVRPGLTSVRRIIGVSTYGSSRATSLAFTDAGRRILLRSVRGMAPLRQCRTQWLALHRVERCSEQQRARFLARVEASTAKR